MTTHRTPVLACLFLLAVLFWLVGGPWLTVAALLAAFVIIAWLQGWR